MLLFGTDESVIEDVSFNGISFELTDSKLNEVAGGNVDLRGVIGEKNKIFERDIPGLLIDHAKNFSNLRISNFNGDASPVNKSAARVYLENGDGFVIDDPKGVVKNNKSNK